MRVLRIFAALLLGAATPALSQQAFSKSMLECSVIYDEVTRIGTTAARTPERLAQARSWSDAFSKAAAVQARQEGQRDVDGYSAGLRAELEQKWSGRFASIQKLQENKDWLGYCRSFGRARGILPD